MKPVSLKNTRLKAITVLTVLFLSLSIPSFSTEYQRLYKGIRPLGMGGAFTAVANDANALFYNPAGLRTFSKVSPNLDVSFELSDNIIDLLQDASDADLDSSEEVADIMEDYVGERQHMRVSIVPGVAFPVGKNTGAMVSGLLQTNVEFEVNDPTDPKAYTSVIADAGILAGFGMDITAVEGLSAGASLKFIHRESLFEVYYPEDIASDNFEDTLEDDLLSGSGVSLDVGVLYKLPMIHAVDTNVALVFQNFPEMDMGDAVDIDSQVNFGIAASKTLSNILFTAALDYRDITKNLDADNDLPKRLHMGIEAIFPKILSLRMGLYQGYVSYGLTLDLWVFHIEAASYAEELGAHAGQKDDRRYIAQFGFGW